jgi:hypothetical protein
LKRNNPGCCGCPGAPPATCNPCPLPKSNLTLTWNHTFTSDYTCPTDPTQTFTETLAYVGNVPSIENFTTDVWRTACFNRRLTAGNWNDVSGIHCFDWCRWELVCKRSAFIANSVLYLVTFRSESACNTNASGQFAIAVFNPSPGATCSPLHIVYGPGTISP